MEVTLDRMAKTEQVRIPVDLAQDARIAASALGMSLPEYVTEQVRRAVKRDLPRAAKIVSRRAELQGQEEPAEDNPD